MGWNVWFTEIDSSIGPLRLVVDTEGLRRIDFLASTNRRPPFTGGEKEKTGGCLNPDDLRPGTGHTACIETAVEQLQAYFAGRLRDFDVPLAPEGTSFQQSVWQSLREIPYGETISYSELAARVGNPKACRAVGLANGQNPIPIMIPCHRVVGKSGRLVGYGGGLSIKERLLALERPLSLL